MEIRGSCSKCLCGKLQICGCTIFYCHCFYILYNMDVDVVHLEKLRELLSFARTLSLEQFNPLMSLCQQQVVEGTSFGGIQGLNEFFVGLQGKNHRSCRTESVRQKIKFDAHNKNKYFTDEKQRRNADLSPHKNNTRLDTGYVSDD